MYACKQTQTLTCTHTYSTSDDTLFLFPSSFSISPCPCSLARLSDGRFSREALSRGKWFHTDWQQGEPLLKDKDICGVFVCVFVYTYARTLILICICVLVCVRACIIVCVHRGMFLCVYARVCVCMYEVHQPICEVGFYQQRGRNRLHVYLLISLLPPPACLVLLMAGCLLRASPVYLSVKVIKSSRSLGNGKERKRQACGSGLIPQEEDKDGPAKCPCCCLNVWLLFCVRDSEERGLESGDGGYCYRQGEMEKSKAKTDVCSYIDNAVATLLPMSGERLVSSG